MKSILELFASAKSFAAAGIGILMGLIIAGIMLALASVITAKLFGAWVSTIRIFGKTGQKDKRDADRIWHRDTFVLTPKVILRVSPGGDYADELKKMNTTLNLISFMILSIYAFIFLFLTWRQYSFGATILKYSALFVAIETVLLIIKFARFNLRKGSQLEMFCQERLNELRNGAPLENLNMSIPDGVIDKADRKGKVFYYHLCFSKSLINRNYTALNGIVRQIDAALRKNGPKSEYVDERLCSIGYYDILFYSSYINPNPRHAQRIYNFIRPTIEADMDVNGRRVLAYYQFYILKQAQAAAITLSQASQSLQNVDTEVFVPAEINLERRLLEELQNNMTRIISPGSFTRPIIENTYDDVPLI